MNVGAGQYMSSNVAMTTFPIIPPNRAATIEIATPVARRFVGNTSVIRQSNEALPHAMIPVKIAETIKFCCLFVTKYMPAEHRPAVNVLKIRKNFRPRRSMPSIAAKKKNQTEIEYLLQHNQQRICNVTYQ